MRLIVKNSIIESVLGDITDLDTEAIVNAAGSDLIMGGGVAGAIRVAGGPTIQEECDRIGGTPTGTAVITGAGKLKASYVIHAVGPIMGEGDEDRKLASATINSLKVADGQRIKTIAFPAISTGIYRYPMDRCAVIMLKETMDYLKGETGLKKVVFCLHDSRAYGIFEKAYETLKNKMSLNSQLSPP